MDIDRVDSEDLADDDGLDGEGLDDLLGDEIVEDFRVGNEKQQKKIFHEPLTNAEINEIQAHLRTIKRPAWNRGPPTNLGEAEHGKLKAEQWRSAIEFDLPMILQKMWGPRNSPAKASETSLRRENLAHSTMLLAIAIRWGTSYVTSEYHARQYKEYMSAYQTCLQTIFPEMEWRPNHHASLHLDGFIRRYGPMHGWWMFPFERVIGCLQKTNTNHKMG